jgi:hypothetical protein
MFAGRPGLIARGDFAVTQRAAGANMSVDIAAGAAIVYPAQVTRQGPYYVQSDATYNTSSDGGYSWTAADATNPRIDLVCLEVKDNAEDASGSTGLRFRIVDGTPSASATHQLLTTYWPAVPTGCVPIAAIKIPATDTSISTTDITNLNPIAGPNQAYNYISTAETTTSASYTRLTNSNGTADFVFVYVPHAYARVKVFAEGWWKAASAATGGTTFYLNDTQLKFRNLTNGAPAVAGYEVSLGTAAFHSRYTTAHGGNTSTTQFFSSVVGATADVSNITTGIGGASTNVAPAPVEITQLAAGWYVIEQRFKTSASTLTVDERYLWAEVIA